MSTDQSTRNYIVTPHTIRLEALCSHCGATACRIISSSRVAPRKVCSAKAGAASARAARGKYLVIIGILHK
jgi:hypothetical protein